MKNKFLIFAIIVICVYGFFFHTIKGKTLILKTVELVIAKSFPMIPQVDPNEIVRGSVLVDVRTRAEQEVSMIPGSITREQFEQNREKFWRSKIVFYCTAGFRSSEYAQVVKSDSFSVSNLNGGILAWAQAGLPLAHNGKYTRRVHTLNRFLKLVPTDYVPVY